MLAIAINSSKDPIYVFIVWVNNLNRKLTETKNLRKFKESLILAQDERWRDALHMQVVRESLTQVADG